MEKQTNNNSLEQEYIQHKFIIQGIKVSASFPKGNTGENIMPMVINMLVDSYVSNDIAKKSSI